MRPELLKPDFSGALDSKVAAAIKLGIIDGALGKEIVGYYTARNYIHIHAELRQTDLEWQLAFARDAYRRLLPFQTQVTAWRALRGRVPPR